MAPKIVTRSGWGAMPWRRPRPKVPRRRRTHFVVHYHGGAVSQQRGVAVPRNVERIHRDGNGWSGVGYNWMVDMDGTIYEGAGWDLQGAHSPVRNVTGIGVYLAVGGDQVPTDAALRSVLWLYAEAERIMGRRLVKSYHSDGYATECPGKFLTQWVKDGMPAPSGGGGSAPAPKPSAPSKPAPVVGRYRVNTKSAPLNGRAGPGKSHAVTMTAAKGYVLDIVEVRGGWAKSTGGHWYSMSYLVPEGGLSGAGRYRVVTKSAPLNGRAGPGKGHKVTMTAAKNYVLDVVEVRNGWAKSTGGHWYSMDYLRKI